MRERREVSKAGEAEGKGEEDEAAEAEAEAAAASCPPTLLRRDIANHSLETLDDTIRYGRVK